VNRFVGNYRHCGFRWFESTLGMTDRNRCLFACRQRV
jgi:hypothetical protein